MKVQQYKIQNPANKDPYNDGMGYKNLQIQTKGNHDYSQMAQQHGYSSARNSKLSKQTVNAEYIKSKSNVGLLVSPKSIRPNSDQFSFASRDGSHINHSSKISTEYTEDTSAILKSQATKKNSYLGSYNTNHNSKSSVGKNRAASHSVSTNVTRREHRMSPEKSSSSQNLSKRGSQLLNDSTTPAILSKNPISPYPAILDEALLPPQPLDNSLNNGNSYKQQHSQQQQQHQQQHILSSYTSQPKSNHSSNSKSYQIRSNSKNQNRIDPDLPGSYKASPRDHGGNSNNTQQQVEYNTGSLNSISQINISQSIHPHQDVGRDSRGAASNSSAHGGSSKQSSQNQIQNSKAAQQSKYQNYLENSINKKLMQSKDRNKYSSIKIKNDYLLSKIITNHFKGGKEQPNNNNNSATDVKSSSINHSKEHPSSQQSIARQIKKNQIPKQSRTTSSGGGGGVTKPGQTASQNLEKTKKALELEIIRDQSSASNKNKQVMRRDAASGGSNRGPKHESLEIQGKASKKERPDSSYEKYNANSVKSFDARKLIPLEDAYEMKRPSGPVIPHTTIAAGSINGNNALKSIPSKNGSRIPSESNQFIVLDNKMPINLDHQQTPKNYEDLNGSSGSGNGMSRGSKIYKYSINNRNQSHSPEIKPKQLYSPRQEQPVKHKSQLLDPKQMNQAEILSNDEILQKERLEHNMKLYAIKADQKKRIETLLGIKANQISQETPQMNDFDTNYIPRQYPATTKNNDKKTFDFFTQSSLEKPQNLSKNSLNATPSDDQQLTRKIESKQSLVSNIAGFGQHQSIQEEPYSLPTESDLQSPKGNTNDFKSIHSVYSPQNRIMTHNNNNSSASPVAQFEDCHHAHNSLKSPEKSDRQVSDFKVVSIKNSEGQNFIKLEREYQVSPLGNSGQKPTMPTKPKPPIDSGRGGEVKFASPRSNKNAFSEEIEQKLNEVEKKKAELLQSYTRIDELKKDLQKLPHKDVDKQQFGGLPRQVEPEGKPKREENHIISNRSFERTESLNKRRNLNISKESCSPRNTQSPVNDSILSKKSSQYQKTEKSQPPSTLKKRIQAPLESSTQDEQLKGLYSRMRKILETNAKKEEQWDDEKRLMTSKMTFMENKIKMLEMRLSEYEQQQQQ